MTDIQTVTMDEIPLSIERDALDGGDYMNAASFLRDGAFWSGWAMKALLALAVGHILSGIIFFFAFNWGDMPAMTKFAVVGGGIASCLFAWVAAKLDSPVGQAFGIGATVLVGVMFAVLGQVYQTPAMIYTPFVFWALLTLPFALASRNLAHWAVWLVILTVAVTSYGISGLRLVGDDFVANALNVATAGAFFGVLLLLDQVLSPKLSWARAEWFRVLLVLGAVGFSVIGFTESFWDDGSGLWLLGLIICGGLVVYLYRLKPSLATLSLASFGVFLLVAQFGFKLLTEARFELGGFFLIFVWLAGLTVALVALFRHFVARFRKASVTDVHDVDDEVPSKDVSVSAFAKQFGLDGEGLRETLSAHGQETQPWYMSVFLAIAGVLTALLGFLFFGFFAVVLVGLEEEFAFGVVGIVIFVGAIFMRRNTNFVYLQHILNTMIVIGGLLTVFGFGIELKDFDAILVLILILCVVVLVAIKDDILGFLAAATCITVIGMELYHLRVSMVETSILILSTGAGVVLLTQPIGRRLYKSAGTALLMAPAVLGIGLIHIQRWGSLADPSRFSDDWPARLLSLAVLLVSVVYLNRGRPMSEFKPALVVLVPLLIGASIVPLGGASALLLILTGYILGSRSLAIIGTLLQIYFLTMFYYDLSFGLLTKSIVLFVSGLVFLGVWVFVRRAQEVSA